MVKVFSGKKDEFYMDGYLETNLSTAKKVIKQDWDMVFCVDGAEGSGKSVLAQQMAYFCDPTLDNTRIVFTPQEFRRAIVNSKKYQSVIYDEAYTGLSSRASMTMINRALVSMLAEIRQKNLFVFVVMPTFFDLDKYVALWRSRALIHVYTGKNFQRGFFAFYNGEKKKGLYVLGKKFYNYGKPRPNFIGRFTDHYTVDIEEYKKNKRNSLLEREKKVELKEKKQEVEGELLDRVMSMEGDIPHSLKMKMLGMPSSTYFVKLKKWKENQEMN